MDNSKKYRNVREEYLDNSDANNTEVTEGRVSFIRSTDAGEELMKDAKVYNPPTNLLPVDDQNNEPEHEQLAGPPQAIIDGRPVEHKNSINLRALKRKANTYELNKFEKNIMLIFYQFDVPVDEHRHGTEEDVDALKKTFEPLGFECTEYKDLIESEIFEKLDSVIETTNFTDIGCVAVCILTHGEKDGMLWAKDKTYSEVKVQNHLKGDRSSTLLTKPKLLIIQACRCLKSTQLQEQLTLFKDHKEQQHYYLPIEADILVLHGSALHTPAINCKINGSWLIQTLCSNIEKLAASEDLESILVVVKRAVAIYKSYEETNDEGETALLTQMPVVTSTLLRKLYFYRSGFEVEDATGPLV